jgi:hypothetical protein
MAPNIIFERMVLQMPKNIARRNADPNAATLELPVSVYVSRVDLVVKKWRRLVTSSWALAQARQFCADGLWKTQYQAAQWHDGCQSLDSL